MSNEKGYIPFIFNEAKEPLFEGPNGIVQQGDPATLLKPDGEPARLKTAPTQWSNTLLNFARSLTYLGVFREFTVPMTFTRDAAKIIRSLLWGKGKNVIAYYALTKWDRTAYPAQYNKFFVGELDFYKSKQSQDGKKFTINVMEGGLSKLLKSNEGKVYEININEDAEKKTVYLDGLPFSNKVTYTVYSGQEILGTTDPQFYFMGMGIVEKTGLTQGVIMQDQLFESSSAYPNDKYFQWSVTKTLATRISGTISGICHAGSGGVLTINLQRASDSSNTIYETVALGVTGGPFNAGQPWSATFDHTINVNPHDRLYIKVGAMGATNKFMIQAGEIDVEYDVSFDPTLTDGLTPWVLFQRLTDKMTDGKYGCRSSFLQNMDDLVITSGTALRRLTPSSIKTSFTDFFQAMRTRGKKKYSIGLGIEGDQLVLEELDYFFQKNVTIMDLGIVKDLEIVVAEDLLYNTVKSGYLDQTVDDINGRNEVNVLQRYSTPNLRITKELDLVSPYRADPYGIESARTDEFGQKQTSSTADNETFMLSVIKNPYQDVQYYIGDFQVEINTGNYYIKIPQVLDTITPGEKIVIAGAVSNNGTFTVISTTYIIAGFTYIRVLEPVTNETISTGTLTYQSTTVYSLWRPAYTSITGVANPTRIYNVELSPKRSVLNCGGLIRSTHDQDDIKLIKFDSAVRNIELSTTIGGVTITEKDSIVIGSLQNKLFMEYYMNFTTQVPINYPEIMKTNPYGKVKFTDAVSGKTLYGFLWDGGIQPEPNEQQTWKLIAAPDQNLTGLIP